MKHLRQIWDFLSKPDVYWRLFSLVLAIIFWLLAAGDGSLGGTERIIALNVEVHNLPSDLVLIGSPGQVRVRIRGLSPILNRGENNLRASIDLGESTEGMETFTVDVDAPTGIEVVSITPRWVSVRTEELAFETFPVTLALLGLEPTNLNLAVSPNPAVVTVEASRSILERVDHVVAYVRLSPDLQNVDDSFPVQALDAQGRSLGPLKIEPSEISVTVEVQELNGEE